MLARRSLLFALSGALSVLAAAGATDADRSPPLKLTLRSQVPSATDRGTFKVVSKRVSWHPRQTAVIVCDMWDTHHCLSAALRVTELAPRMNEVLEKARAQGALIIHAPSGCMEAYKDHPGRKLAQGAPKAANLPPDIGQWCNKIPAEEQGQYPLDQSDGGCDAEPTAQRAFLGKLKAMGRNPKAPWKSEIDLLKIRAGDAISDSGVEIWNLLEQRGIGNVILVGVHTNMCVLGRPFGLRQLAKHHKTVVLMRDMTDTMYNPARPPYVSHFRGTELIVEHIEKYVCPTITSDQLLGGQPFRFKGDVR
jgi:nicotinamidase-related amidase